jgi:hypothetical protein
MQTDENVSGLNQSNQLSAAAQEQLVTHDLVDLQVSPTGAEELDQANIDQVLASPAEFFSKPVRESRRIPM